MGYRENAYDLVLVLHVLAAIVGFGGVMLNGIYGLAAKRAGGVEGLAIARANHKVSSVAEKAIYAVPVFGIGLVLMSDGAIKFSETWVWLALVLYAIAISLSHAVMYPSVNRMIVLMGELASVSAGGVVAGGQPTGGPPPQEVEMEALGKRVGITGAALNLFVVTILVLMIFKPGGTVL
jgi:uncharacterized membrane protein